MGITPLLTGCRYPLNPTGKLVRSGATGALDSSKLHFPILHHTH